MTRPSALLFASLAIAALAGAACDDKKPVADTTPSATPIASATAAPSASATAAPSASAMASATASGTASAMASASGTPSASASANAMNGIGVCGKKPLPNCPLQGWMKQNTSAAMSTQDFDALAKALDATVAFAPPGYGNWASISRDGAAAARAQNLDGVKASCKGCHNQYQTRYRNELRTRKI
jgi:hypothetical protein